MNQHEMDLRRKAFFNDHAEGWLDTFYKNPETGRLDRHAPGFERLFSILSPHHGDTVLDMGCGCGILVPPILDRIGPEGRLYEVDYAEAMIAVNMRLHPDARITFLTESVESMTVSCGSVDTAVCFACFPHFRDKPAALREIGRTLKPGGSLTIAHLASSEEINDHHGKHECVRHDRLPSEGEMRALLEGAGYRIESSIDEPGFYCVYTTYLPITA